MLSAGPIVVWSATFLTYVPLTAEGRTFIIVSQTTVKFSINFSVSNEQRPTVKCKLPSLSTRYSTLPPLISVIAFAMSIATVPVLGLALNL